MKARVSLVVLAVLVLATPGAADEITSAWIDRLDALPGTTTGLRFEFAGGHGPNVAFRNDHLSALDRLEKLTHLDLSVAGPRSSRDGVMGSWWNLRLTDHGLTHIAHIPTLTTLKLSECADLTDDGIALLARSLPRLRRLSIPFWGGWGNRNDAGLAGLRLFRALEHLDLTGCNGSRAAQWPDRIAEMPNLVTLDVSRCPWVAAGGLKPLARLPRLSELRLDTVTDADLLPVETLLALKRLVLACCPKLTTTGLVPISRLSGLSEIEVSDAIRVESIAPLAAVTGLASLDLHGCRALTDDGLSGVAKLRSLERLDLRGCREITDAGLAHVAGLVSLRDLDLSGEALGGTMRHSPCAITDAGLVHLARLTRLRRLNLNGIEHRELGCAPEPIVIDIPTRITDRGLETLSRLTDLEFLGLARSPGITDAGLARLTRMKALRELDLRHCENITPQGLERLAKTLPGCRIVK